VSEHELTWTVPATGQRELDVLMLFERVLIDLSPDQRRRVIHWLADRFGEEAQP
jgi:hypothetical protein